MIQIDGSHLEGGGQILRTALAFSTLTLQPFEITNIRKGRPKPGLQPQHLACVKALEEFCNASSEGAELGSETVKFFPGKPQSRTLGIDIGTAGSVTLLLQSLLLPALFGPGKVRFKLTGGTDVSHSQPVDYFNQVFLPHLSTFGRLILTLAQRGYFPKGNGKVELEVVPFFPVPGTFADLRKEVTAPPINLIERGKLLKISGISHASADLRKGEVADRQAKAARLLLSQQLTKAGLDAPISLASEYSNSLSTGSGITLFAHFASIGKEEADLMHPIILAADALGARGKSSEAVGEEAVKTLMPEILSGATVDRYLADQLIPFMALSGGSIKTSEITKHTLSNIFVVEQFIGKCFEVDIQNKIVKTII